MPLPEDREARLRCFRNALRNWSYRGYVRFKPIAEEWLLTAFPEYSVHQIAGELYHYVEKGGEIDEQKELRPEFKHFEYHYDLRVRIGTRKIYFESILKIQKDPNDPDDPSIIVVSAHDV